MHFEYLQLAAGELREIVACDRRHKNGVLSTVVGLGRGCTLYGKAAPVTLLLPLRGNLQLSDHQAHSITPGQVLVLEESQDIRIVGRGAAVWIALFASTRAWHKLTDGMSTHASYPILFPGVHRADRLTRRGFISLARAIFDTDKKPAVAYAAAVSVATSVGDLQAGFDELIERCAGRTRAQRRSVFLRLQRVSNLMASTCHLNFDLAYYARIASYSPCHFIRAFHAVYGETPHALLVEQRLRYAHRLLNSSPLAICEVARSSGFEDRTAFARSFKRRFGITATDVRDARFQSLRAVA